MKEIGAISWHEIRVDVNGQDFSIASSVHNMGIIPFLGFLMQSEFFLQVNVNLEE